MMDVDKQNIIFWNTDTQNDLMNPDGALSVDGAVDLKGNLMRITKYAKFKGIRVVNTKDDHNEKSAELSDNPDFVETFPTHCLNGTEGAEFIYETNPEFPLVFDWRENMVIPEPIPNRNIIIYKDKFDVFIGNQQTDEIVKMLDFQTVFVYGVCGDVCVAQAVDGLLERGKKVYVFEDAVASLNDDNFESLKSGWMKNPNFGVLSFSDIEEYI